MFNIDGRENVPSREKLLWRSRFRVARGLSRSRLRVARGSGDRHLDRQRPPATPKNVFFLIARASCDSETTSPEASGDSETTSPEKLSPTVPYIHHDITNYTVRRRVKAAVRRWLSWPAGQGWIKCHAPPPPWHGMAEKKKFKKKIK